MKTLEDKTISSVRTASALLVLNAKQLCHIAAAIDFGKAEVASGSVPYAASIPDVLHVQRQCPRITVRPLRRVGIRLTLAVIVDL